MIDDIWKEISDSLQKIEDAIEETQSKHFEIDINDAPEIGSRWVRKDNAFDRAIDSYNGYKVLYITNTAHIHTSHPPQVVYEGDNGNIWSLPLYQWPGNLEKE